MTKEELLNSPWFHTVNPSDLEGIDEYCLWLEALLHNPCSIFNDNGEMILLENKHLVDRVEGLKIEVYANEHPPPHFHVKSPNVDASFVIENCQLLSGKISNRDKDKIIYWHKHAKNNLVEAWNSTRPTNCVVGKYNGVC